MRQRVEVYGRILDVLIPEADDESSEFARELDAAWRGRAFHTFYASTLLVLSGLRADALETGPSHPLYAAIAVATPELDVVTRAAVLAAVAPPRFGFWDRVKTLSVQTNETSRALVWLWPLALLGASQGRRPFALVDIGASAGLNLVADSMSNIWTDAGGEPLDVVRAPAVLERVGVDRAPLDPGTEASALWLRACVWPGQTARQERVEEAIATWRDALKSAGESIPRVRVGDLTEAAALAREVTRSLPAGTLTVAYQSIVREYLDPETNQTYETSMRAWLEESPEASALWLEFEPTDHLAAEFAVGVTAHFRSVGTASGVTSLELGRCDYHPRVLSPCVSAVDAFVAAFA